LGASIAHEMRTPLSSVGSGIKGVIKQIPLLIDSYKIAQAKKIDVPYINPVHYQLLLPACHNIEAEVQAAFLFIDMLLMKVNPSALASSPTAVCSIAHCVDEMLERYPLDEKEKQLVHWQKTKDFQFLGNDMLIIHVLFNLLKNAIYYVKSAGKGNIQIWLRRDKDYNYLHFKDTGAGISPKILSHIFDQFFSRTQHGAGVGLAFCKSAMLNIGGDIVCRSEEGGYAEFILKFPVLE